MSEWATNIPAGASVAGLDELRAARDFEGAPREFWPTCLAALAHLGNFDTGRREQAEPPKIVALASCADCHGHFGGADVG